MAEAKIDEVKVDDFEAAFEAAVVAGEAQVHAKVDDKIDDDKTAVTPPPDGETEEAKATREAAEKVISDKAAADALAAETPEAKTAREAAEAETARVSKVAADAQLVTDAAAATLAEINDRKAAKKLVDDEAARVAATTETPEQKTARETHEASIAPYVQTPEEIAAEEKFKKDFPDEYAAMVSKFKGVDKDINARVSAAVSRVLQHINGVVAPVAQTSEELSRQAHITAIKTAHTDFDAVVTKLPEWIKTQPVYLQDALQKVYDAGSAASVIAMVSDYKKATGTPAPGKTAAELAAAETARATAEETARKAKEDAESLLPVKGKRTITQPKGAADMQDFDGAFAEAAAL